MKRILSVFIFLACIPSNSQLLDTSIYADISGYKASKFSNNPIFSGEIGIGFFNDFWITPEIGLHYGFGSLEDTPELNLSDTTLGFEGIIKNKFSIILASFSPKIAIGKNEENLWWVLQPTFLTGNSTIKGDYLQLANDMESYDLIEQQEVNQRISYFTFAIGLEGYILESEKIALSFSIKYTTNPIGKRLNTLEFSETNQRVSQENTQNLGFGVKVIFLPFKKTANN